MTGEATLLLGVLFGSLGFGYVVYGKRQGQPIALVVGLALVVVPYLVSNVWGLLLAGIGLALAPFWLRNLG